MSWSDNSIRWRVEDRQQLMEERRRCITAASRRTDVLCVALFVAMLLNSHWATLVLFPPLVFSALHLWSIQSLE